MNLEVINGFAALLCVLLIATACVWLFNKLFSSREENSRVLVLDSFCIGNPSCTVQLPCRDCLGKCSTAYTRRLTHESDNCLDHQRMERFGE